MTHAGRAYEYDWVDAFSARPFGGNGCAVVHDAGDLSPEDCIAFTRETGLVECAFIEPSDTADVKVRYFLASGEIPFAGHPTIAAVSALWRRGRSGGGLLTLETGAGLIPIEVSVRGGQPWVTMTQRPPKFGPLIPRSELAELGGLRPEQIIAPPQQVSTGLPFIITLLDRPETLAQLKLNLDALARRPHAGGPALVEPFWAALGGVTPEGDTSARLLLAPPQPSEDPFTGSATGALAAYLWRHGHLDTPRFTAEQGHLMGRLGRAEVELLGPPEAITGVRVSGAGYVLMSGTLHL